MQQYDKYCKPYIRSKFSSDFTSKLSSDKTMKTCNNFFGCGECMEGKKDGTYVTQQDCNRIFNRNKQQWRIKSIKGKNAWTIENDEYNNCITAPTTSTGYFKMAKCDGSAAQAFDFLEMSKSFGDPRIVVRVYGTDKNGTVPGYCMTTERYAGGCVGKLHVSNVHLATRSFTQCGQRQWHQVCPPPLRLQVQPNHLPR